MQKKRKRLGETKINLKAHHMNKRKGQKLLHIFNHCGVQYGSVHNRCKIRVMSSVEEPLPHLC